MTGRFIVGPIVRDLQAAEDIGDRARLGWFDKEFNFYGTAYVKGNEEYYLISANPVRVYDFSHKALCENIFCSPVELFVKKCSVPSGTDDSMAQDLKIIFGKKMREKYSQNFLQEFQNEFSILGYEDCANEYLDNFQNDIDGLFDEELLDLFHILVVQAYSERKLTKYAYQRYLQWIEDVQSDMDDDLIVKDIYHKTMYCLMYEENNTWKSAINAQKERLYSKKFELMRAGRQTLPIYGKTYWYNTDYRLSDVRADFKKYLDSFWMKKFFKTAFEINQLPSVLNKNDYKNQCRNMVEKYGEGISNYLIYYGCLWGCLR